MTNHVYDKSSVSSIYEHALKLTGYSLSEKTNLPVDIVNQRNRGDLGTLIEKFYFQHTPPNNSEPDFPEAGLELKTTGLKKNAQGEFLAKERLVLTMINFQTITKEEWNSSTFMRKCKKILILFYLFNKETPVIDRKFIRKPMVLDFSPVEYQLKDDLKYVSRIPSGDLAVIEKDWYFIRQRVLDGKAHEISEGDTFYLAACRKGSGGENETLQSQPFSKEKAKTRAFSFKPSYINRILKADNENYDSLGIGQQLDFEQAVRIKFGKYIGKSINEISKTLNFYKLSNNHKGFHRDLTNRILSIKSKKPVEFEKAGIEIKTIRLNSKGLPRESMSFPAFNFMEIIEQQWEDSIFFSKLENKFLFVVYKTYENGNEVLERVFFWNMPYRDRLEARRVWELTKTRLIAKNNNLPTASESYVAHVRPKGRDSKDLALTPSGEMKVKQCFWLNKNYIADVLTSSE